MNRICIERLVDDTSFSMSLLNRLREEESNCKDVHRLTAIIDVSLGLVGTGNECQKVRIHVMDHSFPLFFFRNSTHCCIQIVGAAGVCVQAADASLS
jgi:hypothetical protein